MTTVYMDEETKKELAKLAGELQQQSGEKTNFDDAIRFLIDFYKRKRKKQALFEEFTKPVPGVSFENAYEELQKERKQDEERLERKSRP